MNTLDVRTDGTENLTGRGRKRGKGYL
jgi:hypothetical protein